jgi:hypothetical protein
MNAKNIVEILLIALGGGVLLFSAIAISAFGKPVDFLGLHMEAADSRFIVMTAGAFALVGGIASVMRNPKRVE